MSERTVIGGTSYEAVGSSSSNLLLKCNGTARIQWGNKLIDLIKNGKLATENQEFIFNVSDESEIKLDGIYILSTEEITQLWACKKGLKYNLTEANLYISAVNKLEITAELKTQALQNIGMYYNTLEEAKNSGMKNGIVYIVETQSLYTIKEGEFKIFEGSATITVEDDNTEEGVINGSLKIVLSVGGIEYLTLSNSVISVKKSLELEDYSHICSKGANSFEGYKLYMQDSKSYLEIDNIIVRDSIEGNKQSEFIEVTFNEVVSMIANNTLKPHKWYCLTDYKNPWKCEDKYQNRPLLLRALTYNTWYDFGYLYDNLDVQIKYDFDYLICIKQTLDITGECPECGGLMSGEVCETCGYDAVQLQSTKGRIIWMKDLYGNEANFDFLDYPDFYHNLDITSNYSNGEMLTIFPPGSTNNKIKVYNLRGIEFKENDDKTHSLKEDGISLQFGKYDSTEENNLFLEMNNNTLVINGNFTISESCSKFNNNTIDNIDMVDINGSMVNNSFSELKNCTLNANFSNTSFKAIENVTFEEGELKKITCEDDYRPKSPMELNSENQELLYEPLEEKLVYVNSGILLVESLSQQKFSRGMIMMHSGLTAIPSGWAICDGTPVNYNGELITTPNLVNRFIKAVNEPSLVGEWNNYNNGNSNDFKLLQEHLPSHSHPHAQHTHTISGLTGTIENSGNLTLQLSNNNYINSVSKTTTSVVNSIDTADIVYGNTTVIDSVSSDTLGGTATGGNHTHNLTISGGIISNTESTEQKNTTWTNLSFKIEPNYYSLIFIMKL